MARRVQGDRGAVPRAALRLAAGPYRAFALWAVAFGSAAVGQAAIDDPAWRFEAWLLFAVAAALAAWAALLVERSSPAAPSANRPKLENVAIVCGLALCAAALRLPDLTSTPPDVHGDEAMIGIEARRVLEGDERNPFALGWAGHPMLSFTIHAATMRVFGDDLFGLRLASALLGVLSVVFTYLLTRRLFGPRAAVIAAALLVVAQFHVHFSRTGFHYMQAVAATTLVLWLVVRACDERRLLDFALAGLAVGLAAQVYFAARLAPLLAAAYVLHRALAQPGFARAVRRGVAVAVATAAVSVSPVAVAYLENRDAFSSRTREVWVLSPQNLVHSERVYGVEGKLDILAAQARRTVEAFNLRGETSAHYGRAGPLLDFWSALLLVIGVGAVTALAVRDSRHFLVALWFWGTLVVAGVLTVDAPAGPRIVTIAAAAAVVGGVALELGWRAAGRFGGAFAAGAVVLLAAAAAANVQNYFREYVRKPTQFAPATELSHFAQRINDRYRIYYVGRPDTPLFYETQRFLVPTLDGEEAPGGMQLPLRTPPAAKGAAFVVQAEAPGEAATRAAVESAYPRARRETIRLRDGTHEFTAYFVSRAELVAPTR